MKPPSPPSDAGTPEEQAARWLTRRGEDWTAAEAEAFEAWREASPANAAAAERFEATERLLARLPRSDLAAEFWDEIDGLTKPCRRVFAFPSWGAAAAAAAVVLMLTVGAVVFSLLAPYEAQFTTAAGTTERVALPDGSDVVLAEDTALEIRFSRQQRQLHLTRGEAEFNVTKDPERPFRVAAGAYSVTAVGTAFTVRHEESRGIEVIVTEGQVRVTQESPGSAAERRLAASGWLLAAGEQLRWGGAGAEAAPIVTSTAHAAALAENPPSVPRLVFADTPLVEAVAQFNRYSSTQLEIGDAALAGRTVGGNFSADAAESFAGLLAANGDIILERPNPDRIVLRPAP